MGILLSTFRKEKSTTAVLERLQDEIDQLEKYMINTQDRKRRFVQNFLGFTIGIYTLAFALWYFFYFPPNLKERIMNLVPLLLFPIVIVLLRQVFTWYFQRKLNKNGDKLRTLKAEKKEILEQVMNKETYKVAVNLLERFGDNKPIRKSVGPMTNQSTPMLAQGSSGANRATPRTPQIMPPTPTTRQATPYTGVYRSMNNNNLNSSATLSLLNRSSTQTDAVQGLRRRTPFPVVDQRSRTAVDRIVDFIVGDSPQDRFGMICKACHGHNGMLHKDEYEYTTFRCAFCEELNPARKERPVGPRLNLNAIEEAPGTPLSERRGSSDSGSTSEFEEELDPVMSSLNKLSNAQSTDKEATTTTATGHEIETDAETELANTVEDEAIPTAEAAGAE